MFHSINKTFLLETLIGYLYKSQFYCIKFNGCGKFFISYTRYEILMSCFKVSLFSPKSKNLVKYKLYIEIFGPVTLPNNRFDQICAIQCQMSVNLNVYMYSRKKENNNNNNNKKKTPHLYHYLIIKDRSASLLWIYVYFNYLWKT